MQGVFPVDEVTLLMYQLTQLQHLLQRLHLCLQSTLGGLAARGRSAILLLGVAWTRHVAHACVGEGIDALPLLMLLDVRIETGDA